MRKLLAVLKELEVLFECPYSEDAFDIHTNFSIGVEEV